MPFIHDSTGVEPSGGKFQPLPEGEYAFVIQDAAEKTSKKGLPMIETVLSVIEDAQFQGKTIKHWVVFIPKGDKGDGMSVHFRKCIGVAYGGADEVNAQEWVGKKLRAKLKIEKMPSKKNPGEILDTNKVAAVMPYGDDFPEVKGSDVPF